MDVNHNIVFPTLISTFDLTGHQCEQLVTEKINLYDLQQDPNLFDNNKERFLNQLDLVELWKTFQNCADIYCEKADIEPIIIGSSWCKVEKMGGSIQRHRHPQSVLSGSYYPYVEENSSPIVFEDPTTPIKKKFNIFRIFKNELRGEKEIYLFKNYEISPRSGMLIIFPSYIKHWVPQNLSNKRCSVVFNSLKYNERYNYFRDYRVEPHEDK